MACGEIASLDMKSVARHPAVNALPFKGRVRVGMGLNNGPNIGAKPIPLPASPLKGEERYNTPHRYAHLIFASAFFTKLMS